MPVGRFGSRVAAGGRAGASRPGSLAARLLTRGRAGPCLAAVSVPRRHVVARVSSARPFRAREQRGRGPVGLGVVTGRLYRHVQTSWRLQALRPYCQPAPAENPFGT